jgi:MFS transporter, DHA2 family, multidrug resistance protein
MNAANTVGARRWLVLIALSLSVLVVGVDMTVLNVALPTIGPALHASSTDLQWFADAYSLVVAAALLPAGLLGDRYGRKTLLMIGLVLFCVTSAACAYAPNAGTLIAVRAALGLGAAAITPLAMAVLPVMFNAAERPKAIAFLMTSTMLGLPLGPVLGGWLLTRYWWGSVFLINVPITLLAVAAVALLMPQSRNPRAGRFDTVGAVLSSAGLAALTYGLVQADSDGWAGAQSLGTIVAGVALLVLFVLAVRRLGARPGSEPLIDLALFRSGGFSWGTALATLTSFALFGLMFAMPQYFQDVQGTSSLGAGLRLLPMIGGLVVGGGIAARLRTPRPARDGGPALPMLGARPVVGFGLGVMVIGLALGAATKQHSGEGYAALWFVLVGFGLGFALPATTDTALGALSKERAGMGSAVIMAMRQVGGTIGVAVLGTILGSAYRGRLDSSAAAAAVPAPVRTEAGQSITAGVAVAEHAASVPLLDAVRDAFVHAMDGMLVVCAVIALVGTLLAVVFLPGRRAAAAAATAAEGTAVDGAVADGTELDGLDGTAFDGVVAVPAPGPAAADEEEEDENVAAN